MFRVMSATESPVVRDEAPSSAMQPGPARSDCVPGRRKTKIGVALGGGAARGWAHIGVLQALGEMGIEADVIAGTSIGAVVGACFLAGELDRLEIFARGLSRRRLLGLLDFNFNGSSLITGNRLAGLLETNLGDRTIESLGRSFVAVSTELTSGHEVWLSKGPLVPAIQASHALPGVFKPVRIGHRWLIDGALVNPIPVSVCRAFGARVVIAVNLSMDVMRRGAVIPDVLDRPEPVGEEDVQALAGSPANKLLVRQLFGRGEGAPGISSVMVDALNIVQDRIARSRLAGDPPDVTIAPRIGQIGLFEFYRAAEAIALGREAALRTAEDLAEAIERLA